MGISNHRRKSPLTAVNKLNSCTLLRWLVPSMQNLHLLQPRSTKDLATFMLFAHQCSVGKCCIIEEPLIFPTFWWRSRSMEIIRSLIHLFFRSWKMDGTDHPIEEWKVDFLMVKRENFPLVQLIPLSSTNHYVYRLSFMISLSLFKNFSYISNKNETCTTSPTCLPSISA